jgi:hypothetical protein
MGGGPEAGRFLGLGDDITLASVCLTSWDRLGDDPGCQQRSVACRDGSSGKRQLFNPAMPRSSGRRSMYHGAKTRFRGPGRIMLFDDAFSIAPQELRLTRRIGGLLRRARFVAVSDGIGQHYISPIYPLRFKETTAPMSYKPVLRNVSWRRD